MQFFIKHSITILHKLNENGTETDKNSQIMRI